MPDRVSVSVDGRRRLADPTQPLWVSLQDDRLGVVQRSIRYHRPRAPFCGVGYCTQCIVRVNGEPNVRACQYRPRDGDVVESENAWPSARHDAYGAIDLLFPRGLDTVHGFRRPAFLTPLYHRVIRRLAGYGRAPDRPPPTIPPGRRSRTDVLVVGGGRAGSAALASLLERSVPAVLVDDGLVPTEPAFPERIRGRVVFLPPPDPSRADPFEALVIPDLGPGLLVSARSVILAPGGYDAHLVFPGNDRPGVLTAECAFRMSAGVSRPAFRRALVFGGGDRAREVLERFPDDVAAVAAPGPIAPELTRSASERGIRLYPRVILASARGSRRVRSVALSPRGPGTTIQLDVDSVILAHRRLPSPQLLFQVGAKMRWDGDVGHYLPVLDGEGRTSVPGLLAAGEVAGGQDVASAIASGRRAAEAVGRPTESVPAAAVESDARPNLLEGYYREFLRMRAKGGKCIVCPCEDVLLSEVEAASSAGYRGVEVIKRFTGVGTGLCQGRYCVPETLLLLAALEQRPPSEVGYLTQRPPVVPVPLGVLGSLPDEET